MATFNYARARATADRLIAKFGQTGAIRRITQGGGPAHNPGAATETDYPATMAVLEFANYQRDGSQIEAGDKRAYVSTDGLTIEPTPADFVVVGGVQYKIVRASPLSPAGTIVFWDLQVRR